MSDRDTQRPGRTPRAPRRLLLPAVVALTLLAAACGGGSGRGDEVATAGGGSDERAAGADDKSKKDPQQAALEFARCMREHGVEMPDPEVDDKGRMVIRRERPSGPSQATEIDGEAHEACRHLLDGMAGPGDGKIDPEEQDRALKFARCMREHGVDIPDPNFDDGGATFQIRGEGFDPESPTVKAAEEACKEFFGPPGGGEGPAPGPAGSES
ncbi:MAG: hypothetical protein M3179_04880 [Actinomycetota bacterium]|nr:hypothetical protein [Actinomycetota bacterium]